MIFSKVSPRRRASWSKVGAAFAATLLATGGLAYGQSYSTNFTTDSSGYTFLGNNSLSGQGNAGSVWDTNDFYKGSSGVGTPPGDAGQSDYVGALYSTGVFAGNQGALGGLNKSQGYYPTSGTVYLEHPFNPGAATNYTFTTDFLISQPAGATVRDSFGFTFGTGLETNTKVALFSLNFTPNTNTAAPNYLNQMRISYTNNAGATTAATLGGVQQAIDYNGVYHLVLSVNVSGAFTATFTGSNSFTFTGSFGSGSAAAVREFAATWILASTATGNATTGYTSGGSNSLIMDNLSIVPEPSTWAMVGAGVLGLAVFARRRVRA